MSNNANELKQCTRCHSTILLQYFEKNRKGEYFKTCNSCRTYRNKYYEANAQHINEWDRQWREQNRIPCSKCGACIPKKQINDHMGGYPCQTYGMTSKPHFDVWILQQPVDCLNRRNKKLLQTLMAKPTTDN